MTRPRPALLLAALALAPLLACRRGPGPRRVVAQELVLTRQIEGLRSLVDAAEKGSLLPKDKLVVAVSEQVVKSLASLALPREQVVAERFRVRLETIDVRFRDLHGSVRLDGRVSPADHPSTDIFAELAVFGLLDRIELEPSTGVLSAKVSVVGFELKKVGVYGESRAGQALLEELAERKMEDLAALAFPITIPVRFEERIALKAITDGPFRIRAATFPLKVTVADVAAHGERLWIAIDAASGPWTKDAPRGFADRPPSAPATPAGGGK